LFAVSPGVREISIGPLDWIDMATVFVATVGLDAK
jgi:hypothetical protein